MKNINNIDLILGDDLRPHLQEKTKLNVVATYFSMYAYQTLREELQKIDKFQFVFTSPTLASKKLGDRLNQEKREFLIPENDWEEGLCGTDFEIHLKNQLTQKAIAKECAKWVRQKAQFKSNSGTMKMQALMTLQNSDTMAYFPFQGFTQSGLGYEKGHVMSNLVVKSNGANALVYQELFDRIWQDQALRKTLRSTLFSILKPFIKKMRPSEFIFS